MNHVRLALIAAAISLPLSAHARPYPPGSCINADDAVATRGTPPTPPLAASMAIPDPGQSGAYLSVVADLSFDIQADGSVSSLRVLCVTPTNTPFANALLKAAQDWRFTPPSQADAKASRVAYRIGIQGQTVQRVFLGFQPSA